MVTALFVVSASAPADTQPTAVTSGLAPAARSVDPHTAKAQNVDEIQRARPLVVGTRWKVRITLPASGDVQAGGMLLGVSYALGKDYKDAAQMKDTIDFVWGSIAPNAVKFTSDSATMQQLLRAGQIDVAEFWNSI